MLDKNSSLLNAAIADAAMIKEAAKVDVEKAIIAQFQPQIKEALTILLEQDAPPQFMDDEEEIDLDPELDPLGVGKAKEEGIPPEDLESEFPEVDDPESAKQEIALEKVLEDLPSSLVVPSDEDENVIELNLTTLQDEMRNIVREEEDDDLVDQEELASMATSKEPETEIDFKDIVDNGVVNQTDIESEEDEKEDEEDDDEDIEINEADLKEYVNFDFQPQKSGNLGIPQTKAKERVKERLAVDAVDTKTKEEDEKLKKQVTELYESNKQLKKKINQLTKILIESKTYIEETGVLNTKLLYTNKVLRNNSLNERQKPLIVESISKANSVEEVKMAYSTIKSVMGLQGPPAKQKQPKSLREAVENFDRQSSLITRPLPAKGKITLLEENEKLKMMKIAGLRK